MAASADVLALAKIEVEMGSIPEGELCSWMQASCGTHSRLLGISRRLHSELRGAITTTLCCSSSP